MPATKLQYKNLFRKDKFEVKIASNLMLPHKYALRRAI